MKVSVKNIDSVFARLRKAVDDNMNAQYKEKVDERFSLLVYSSPQWSGDLASNWRISLDGNAVYEMWEGKHPNYRQQGYMVEMGDPAAAEAAIAASKGVEYTWRDKVYFANATPLTFGKSTVTGSGTTHAVRPENLIDGRVAMISYVKSRFPS